MKQQKPSPEEDPRTKEMRRKRAKQRFSETAREIHQDWTYPTSVVLPRWHEKVKTEGPRRTYDGQCRTS
jgi:hypothetical protein